MAVERIHHHADLLAVLADAAATGHTPAELTGSLALCFSRMMPLRALDLAWIEGDEADVSSVRSAETESIPKVAQHRLPLAESVARPALAHGKTRLVRARDCAETLAERAVAEALECAWLVVLPLQAGDGDSGFAVLYLDAEPHSRPVIDESLLKTAAKVIALGQARVSAVTAAQAASTAQRETVVEAPTVSKPVAPAEAVPLAPATEEDDDERAGIFLTGRGLSSVRARLARVAPLATPVLLRGEPGVGLREIASYVHALSHRAGDFVSMNCAAQDPLLTARDLFGSGGRGGLLADAGGGTLFLSHIEALSPTAQQTLLNLLVAAETGDAAPDARLIAATHADLDELVRRSQFNADLYFRLNAFPVPVPPLRERPGDITELAGRLLERIARRMARPAPKLGLNVITALCARRWAGNVRELGNVLERALILSPPDQLTLDAESALIDTLAPRSDDVSSFADASRACIARALRACHGQVYGASGAAKLLGLNPSTLQSKMKKLGMNRADYAITR